MEWPRYDDHRAAWILNHYGSWLFQRRRGELIRKRMWQTESEMAGANPSQYTEVVTAPLYERRDDTVALMKERFVVMLGVLFLPIGWPFGRLLYKQLERLVPESITTYPITPLAIAAGAGQLLMAGVYWLLPDLTLVESLVVPFLLAQAPGVLFTASLYGVLEGWLGVPGSTDWWPLPHEELPALDYPVLGPDVLNPPPALPIAEQPQPRPFVIPAPGDLFRLRKPGQ